MKVSYIMSTYNTPNLIKSVDSVLSQEFDDFELILIDDCSTTGVEYFETLTKKKNVRLIRNRTNLGLTRSLNIGLREACGDIIIRLDSNDISVKHRTRVIVDFFEANPDTSIIASGFTTRSNRFQKCKVRHSYLVHSEKELRNKLLYENCLVHSTIAFKKDAILDIGGYRETFKYAQDYDLYLRAIQNNLRIVPIKDALVIKHFNKKGVTLRYRKKQLLYALVAQSLYFADLEFSYKHIFCLLNTFLKLLVPDALRKSKHKWIQLC